MIFKVILCYHNGSTQLLNQFDDELKAIKFTFDMIETGLPVVNLINKPSHLLIEKHEEKTAKSDEKKSRQEKIDAFLQNFKQSTTRQA